MDALTIIGKDCCKPRDVEPNEDFLKRIFGSGATRDVDTNKRDYEGFLSPRVLVAFGEYMHAHRVEKDGNVRDADNWQKGMPLDAYMKSAWRHFMDLWVMHRDGTTLWRRPDGELVGIHEALGGLLFNIQGYWLETLKEQMSGNDDSTE